MITVITSAMTVTMPAIAEIQVDARSVTILAIVALMAAAPLAAMPPAAAIDLLCK